MSAYNSSSDIERRGLAVAITFNKCEDMLIYSDTKEMDKKNTGEKATFHSFFSLKNHLTNLSTLNHALLLEG